jgi:hypothetical protein
MIKLIENIFFTTTITYKATLPGPQINPAGIYSRNTSEQNGLRKKENDYRGANTSIDENDRSSLNFMDWFVKEKSDDEIYPARNSDKMKIAGDGKTEKDAVYLKEEDPANTFGDDRFEQDIRRFE